MVLLRPPLITCPLFYSQRSTLTLHRQMVHLLLELKRLALLNYRAVHLPTRSILNLLASNVCFRDSLDVPTISYLEERHDSNIIMIYRIDPSTSYARARLH